MAMDQEMLKRHLAEAEEHIATGDKNIARQLWRRIRALLRTISDEECLNFFRHAGYASR